VIEPGDGQVLITDYYRAVCPGKKGFEILDDRSFPLMGSAQSKRDLQQQKKTDVSGSLLY